MKEKEQIVVTGLVLLMLLAWIGYPLHHAHRFAGSFWGGVFGVIGSVLMLVPLAYLIVKRNKKLKQSVTKHVSMRTLLAWHIYAGVLGPILVIVHSGHKYESTVGIALTAMTLLVVISGFIGRYLMSGFAKEIREKNAMLAELQGAYDEAVVAIGSNPETVRTLRPFSGFFSRLMAGFFLSESVPQTSTPTGHAMSLVRLTESIADVEFAIRTHEEFKHWFGKWLKFHIVISLLLYLLIVLHIWAAVHFGLRWLEPVSPPSAQANSLTASSQGIPLHLPEPEFATLRQVERFHEHFGSLYQRHWRPLASVNGIQTTVFDYAGISDEASQPNSDFTKAVNALRNVNVELLARDRREKTFWINVYNFAAMKLVAENYPITSIMDTKLAASDPWSIPIVQVGSGVYTLRQIENTLLLSQFEDPRIVFAISCAAVSCPDRTSSIFASDRLDVQLDEILRRLLSNSTKGLAIDENLSVVTLSWIFKADKRLFHDREREMLQFVSRYSEPPIAQWIEQHANELKVVYFPHDWGLNDVALADSRIGN